MSPRAAASAGCASSSPQPALPAPGGNHVLIIGYGLNGENLAHVLRQTGVPYFILEMDPERVAAARQRARADPLRRRGAPRGAAPGRHRHGARGRRGDLRSGGDAAHRGAHAPAATRRFRSSCAPGTLPRWTSCSASGATEVIPEEYETSVEIFARVLRRLRVPRNVIALQVELIRKQGYRMLRGLELPRQTLDQLGHILAATTTETFMVPRHVTGRRPHHPRSQVAPHHRRHHHRRGARRPAVHQPVAGLGDPGRRHPGHARQPRAARSRHAPARRRSTKRSPRRDHAAPRPRRPGRGHRRRRAPRSAHARRPPAARAPPFIARCPCSRFDEIDAAIQGRDLLVRRRCSSSPAKPRAPSRDRRFRIVRLVCNRVRARRADVLRRDRGVPLRAANRQSRVVRRPPTCCRPARCAKRDLSGGLA